MAIIPLLVIIFTYGVLVGHYEFFPYDQLQFLKSSFLPHIEYDNQSHIYETEVSISNRIQIDSIHDLTKKRQNLIEYIWVNGELSNRFPDIIENDVHLENFADIKSLKNIEKFTTLMNFDENSDIKFEQDVSSISYLFEAQNPNNELIIYHQGHAENSIIDSKKNIGYFLDSGYSVLVFSMIFKGENNQPVVDIPKFGKIQLSSHNLLKLLESDIAHPIKFFVEPINVSLNYIDGSFQFEKVHMVGLSGGGWTTIVYSAIDERISESFSISGGFPIYLRNSPENLGDYEQTIAEFYSIANYEELFVMGGYGDNRKSTQIFIYDDPCCFQAELYVQNPYEHIINNKISNLGSGTFKVFLDDSTNIHEISDFALNTILSELNSSNY